MTAKYRLTETYCRTGDLYTADEARAMIASVFGESVTLRETANGTLLRVCEDRPFGLVIGQRVA